MTATRFRYTVRKMTSGRTGKVSYYVYDTRTKGRVSVHATILRDAAQASADRLNILEMCVPADQDPRPYEVRYAEAEAAYRAATT